MSRAGDNARNFHPSVEPVHAFLRDVTTIFDISVGISTTTTTRATVLRTLYWNVVGRRETIDRRTTRDDDVEPHRARCRQPNDVLTGRKLPDGT